MQNFVGRALASESHSSRWLCAFLQALRDVLIQPTAPPWLKIERLEVLEKWTGLIDVVAVGAWRWRRRRQRACRACKRSINAIKSTSWMRSQSSQPTWVGWIWRVVWILCYHHLPCCNWERKYFFWLYKSDRQRAQIAHTEMFSNGLFSRHW